MWRKPRKTLLIISGILYVIFGILAFFNIPGGHDEHHHSFAHNLTHILVGMALLALTLRFPPARRRAMCFVFTAAYFVIGTYGVLAGKHAAFKIVPGLIEFHAGDYAVHLATGLFFFVLGSLKRSDAGPQSSTPALELGR
jgi:hypothetical protein